MQLRRLLRGAGAPAPSAGRRLPAGRMSSLGWRLSGNPAASDLVPLPGSFHVNDGPHHLDVLRELHGILKPGWYLEVGSRGGDSLQVVEGSFVAIDPEPGSFPVGAGTPRDMHVFARASDEVFGSGVLGRLGISPDFGFLDGRHLCELLMRDLMNFEAVARPGAVVALHDCLPCTHAMESRVPPAPTGAPWTGDAWKVLVWVLRHRPDLTVSVLDANVTGLVVIEGLDPENRVLRESYSDFVSELSGLRLADFGVGRFFAGFEIESSVRYLERLKLARAERLSDG